eukprot:TRINITY_DN957_c0_g2_i1.p1 TRINITY_DN957_c0_g2~~TRINITY_DN957_c0_g2_i1.p1  ORF type:complete len:119 (-),score=21.38 TRINITY_DN957_c0_g2_i1:235-567(-)
MDCAQEWPPVEAIDRSEDLPPQTRNEIIPSEDPNEQMPHEDCAKETCDVETKHHGEDLHPQESYIKAIPSAEEVSHDEITDQGEGLPSEDHCEALPRSEQVDEDWHWVPR